MADRDDLTNPSHHPHEDHPHEDPRAGSSRRRERRVHAVVALTAAMTCVEITVGYVSHSMALLADGWHMATHVGVLGIASIAYSVTRRFAGHEAFAFGTGKVNALAGYTSAVALGLVAFTMLAESLTRLIEPAKIDFAHSLPVAMAGLVVNLLSVLLLHEPHAHGASEHGHDHNHRAALLHVIADTLTSCLAIIALFLGDAFGWAFLDPLSGLVGGLVILKWGFDLCRSTAFELLDIRIAPELRAQLQQAVESFGDTQIVDLRLWSMGRGAKAAAIIVHSTAARDPAEYRQRIAEIASLAYLNVEVRRRPA